MCLPRNKAFLLSFPAAILLCAERTPPCIPSSRAAAFYRELGVVAARIIQRVHHEAANNPSDEALKRFLEELLSYPNVPSRWRMLDLDDAPPPFLTINYRWKNSTLRLFSTLTTLGTPLDVALQELRIEALFPADEVTRTAVNRLAEECFASQPSWPKRSGQLPLPT